VERDVRQLRVMTFQEREMCVPWNAREVFRGMRRAFHGMREAHST